MLFHQISGQEIIKQQLIRTVNENRLSHALLFGGPEGCGKLPMALALAQYLNCTNKQENDSCGECPSCKKSNKLVYADLHFVFPIIKLNIKARAVSDTFISEWRQMIGRSPYFNLNQWFEFIGGQKGQGMIYTDESSEIIRKLNLKSYEGEYKIMIIWHPEKMHSFCANKLLKMIEEPPPKTIFILVSDNSGEILGTILSRTQQIKLNRYSDQEIETELVKKAGFDDVTAKGVARLAGGNKIRAYELANEAEDLTLFLERFMILMRLAYGRKLFEMLTWVDEIVNLPKEKMKNFLLYVMRMVRENYIMNLNQPQLVYLTVEEEQFSSKFAPFINDSNAMEMLEEISLAHSHLEQNGNPRIIFTDLVLKMIIFMKH